ncbi:sensor histidine kinase [Blastochloris viridis]|uniref:histidine kinase n=1 Tax=Blastochloris viridis TaxID=1079 RepID=A0A0H5BB48_BLAVI|nr:sensor histidine kinase [Blastochloris viridis]ALK10650.1 Alkaline phosphatase synthesis sensor protein PhoR [Blastochloris viridis]BAR99390.1 sensor histidine kinase ChvG [Blastochloris viridis]CUU43313.1 Alkaline phosphatase synthesis sensor protein phoR [Blastochloris viridis]
MKADVDDRTADAIRVDRAARSRGWLVGLRRSAAALVFSSLTRRIVVLNLGGLAALVAGILYLSEFRAGLIDARIQSLLIQGEIMAGAVAASATVETNAITVDPNRLLEQQLGDNFADDYASPLEFPINPERVAPLLRRLVLPTKTRARIYDRDGMLVLDSRSLYARGDILRLDLPPPVDKASGLEKIWGEVQRWFTRGSLPFYKDLPPNAGRSYPEVAQALAGAKSSMVRMNDRGEVIVSVAVPIQRFRAVLGTLLLSTQGGEIDDLVEQERFVIVRVFVVAALVMVLLSVLLAGTIAGPVRKLADAAERVRRRIKGRVEIPDFTDRTDEIGHLSGALRDMTEALYRRMEAIESFAADVAHELKNPLTSLRSAVETLPLARSEDSRGRLLAVIQHDVKRLDRLITDISDASRLDAELQRQEAGQIDLQKLLTAVVTIANEVRRDDGVKVLPIFVEHPGLPAARQFAIQGHDSRLGQVVHNLIDNARSFSPQGGTVRVVCRRLRDEVEIAVEDDGPGIRPDALEKIFTRFYTDRPEEQGFGQNSGLGLSISRQIVEAHGGQIWAENRPGLAKSKPEAGRDAGYDAARRTVLGARFTVRLPAA